MRAVITSYGTTGCTQPVLALAVEFARHGHEVVVALPASAAGRAAALGLEFVPLGPTDGTRASSIADLTARPEQFAALEYLTALGQEMGRALPLVYEQLRAACQNADVLIGKATQPVARIIHELTGIPFAAFHTFYLEGSATPLGHTGTEAYRRVTETVVNSFRAQFGLEPLRDPLTRHGSSPQLTLFALSRHVVPPPARWPAHFSMPGYFFLDETDWTPDAALARFLNADAPPVVFSFGSMEHREPAAVVARLVEAVKLAGCRAVVQLHEPLPETTKLVLTRRAGGRVHFTGAAPHAWLFPRAACVVQHGGSGTTAAALRAGVPSVFVPHTYDQPTWAEIVQATGCAGPPLAFAELTAERLAFLIARTLATPSFREAAHALGAKLQTEAGVVQARTLIEALVARPAQAYAGGRGTW